MFTNEDEDENEDAPSLSPGPPLLLHRHHVFKFKSASPLLYHKRSREAILRFGDDDFDLVKSLQLPPGKISLALTSPATKQLLRKNRSFQPQTTGNLRPLTLTQKFVAASSLHCNVGIFSFSLHRQDDQEETCRTDLSGATFT